MVKTKEAPPSISSYFRHLFKENPAYLDATSNAEILQRWKEDHPGSALTRKIKANMANTKSVVRKALGMKGKRRRRKKGAMADSVATRLVRTRVRGAVLEALEFKLDDILTLARHYEDAGLGAAVKHLRFARNGVVMKQG